MKEIHSHRFHLGKRKKGDTAQLAAQLAPLEEQNKPAAERQARHAPGSNGGASQEIGAIVIDNTPASLSADITDVRRGNTFMGMEPVALVILVVMLVFIAFVAWQISLMPVE
ncbi:MAG TPA: hypothetical protein VMZ30_07970 [Pyrinomonadaceae bacterium]|nr:hypothetical protein [Pyrinomonadaceae bacterium]